jgi:hypothetical protein
MTNAHLPIRLATLVLGSLFFACENDDKLLPPAIAQFENNVLSVPENNEKSTVKILFSRSASVAGELTIQFNSEYSSHFSIEPSPQENTLTLPVVVGQTFVSFDVVPVNNTALDGDKKIDFTIASITDGFNVGTNKTLSATVVDDETPSDVNFLYNHGSIRENTGAGSMVRIMLSHPVSGSSSIAVSLQSTGVIYGTNFITEPPLSDNRITFSVEAGADHVEFKVIPINDDKFQGDRTIIYSIAEISGPISKGDQLQHELKIVDDELDGKGKGYEIFAGNWRYKKNYTYNENGLLTSVAWEQNTPGYSGGTYTYFYDQDDKIQKIVTSSVDETRYVWNDGRIVKSEEYRSGTLKQFTIYSYDPAGNVGEAAAHYRQPNGEMNLGLLFVYLYTTDGNLYKQLVYTPIEGSDDYNLNSTRTYDSYLDVENPFPMVEIVPNMVSQPKLPASYRVEEGGHNILYTFTYEFSEDGKPSKRTATSSSASEVAYYEYY